MTKKPSNADIDELYQRVSALESSVSWEALAASVETRSKVTPWWESKAIVAVAVAVIGVLAPASSAIATAISSYYTNELEKEKVLDSSKLSYVKQIASVDIYKQRTLLTYLAKGGGSKVAAEWAKDQIAEIDKKSKHAEKLKKDADKLRAELEKEVKEKAELQDEILELGKKVEASKRFSEVYEKKIDELSKKIDSKLQEATRLQEAVLEKEEKAKAIEGVSPRQNEATTRLISARKCADEASLGCSASVPGDAQFVQSGAGGKWRWQRVLYRTVMVGFRVKTKVPEMRMCSCVAGA